ncbi:MAG: hypothetical protein ABW277_27610 [Longimicrobiaceae bacterium]
MNFDQLGEVWRREAGGAPGRSPAEEVAAVRARAAELARVVRRRDLLETGAALAILPVFAWRAATAQHPLAAAGAAIIAAACVLIPIRLWAARRGDPDPGQPVAAALRTELARIRAQERLLGSVAWWYVGPISLGLLLSTAGGSGPPLYRAAYAASVVALSAWLLRLNRRAAREELRPVAEELEGWLAGLDEPAADEPLLNGASDAN